MKRMIILLFVFTACVCGAQQPFNKAAYIEPYQLQVTLNKTTNLVFPASIVSIDRGSQGIVVQKAIGVENILRVKADSVGFAETNLSVITNDGKLYSFLVGYVDSPAYLNINLANSNGVVQPAVRKDGLIYTQPFLDANSLQSYANAAAHRKGNVRSLHDERGKVSIAIQGFYVKGNTLFCKFHLQNASSIGYGIEQLRFYVRDKQQSKRTSSQEVEVTPLYIAGDTSNIEGKSSNRLVAALPKFTIPEGKFFMVELMELNGGRNLAVKVKNRHLIRARTL